MGMAHIGEVDIAYVTDGPPDGEPMLLIMGMGAQLVAWPADFVEMLVAQGFWVIRFDNRDQGQSTHLANRLSRADLARGLAHRRLARADYTLSDMADDAAGLLDCLGVDSAHVVGVSMGGMIAQELTLAAPDRVRSLVSIMSNTGHPRHGRTSPKLLPEVLKQLRAPAPVTYDDQVQVGVEAFRVIAGPHFDEVEIREMVQAHMARGRTLAGRDRQLNAINASPDRTTRLATITAPTLVIHGMLDRLVLPSGGVATARAIPGSRLMMFPDMAHDLPGPRRAELVEAITHNARRARPVNAPPRG